MRTLPSVASTTATVTIASPYRLPPAGSGRWPSKSHAGARFHENGSSMIRSADA